MLDMRKVCIVGGGSAYAHMYRMYGWEVVEAILEADLLQFTGGEDVTPYFYGEANHPATGNNPARDCKEQDLYEQALSKKTPMVGICRGGQFLNVMNGGKMYQHVDRHAIGGTHAATDLRTERDVQVSSTHHQMMRPHKSGEILATARRSSFKEHMKKGELKRIDVAKENDVEVVLYRDTRSLCFQPHPEFVDHSHEYKECADYFFECLEHIL